jgi:hypothetical protein
MARTGPVGEGARGLVQVFRKCDDNFRLNFWRLGKAWGRGPRGAGCLGTVRTALGPALEMARICLAQNYKIRNLKCRS